MDINDIFWLFRIIGGISMINGWLIYHFLDAPFTESIKFVIIGIILISYSLYKERQFFQEVLHQ